jgi:predicted lipase
VPTSITDWIDDLAALTRSPRFTATCPNCDVGDGFYAAYEALQAQVLAALGQMSFSNLIVSGHSLGGAMAAIGAYDLLVNQGMPVTALYTFGEPRTGNDGFAAGMVAALGGAGVVEYRVVHYKARARGRGGGVSQEE